MKRALIALMIVAPAVGAGFYYSSQQDRSVYSSYEAMRDAGLFDAGWVPAALPPSIRDFQGRFDEQTRKGVGSFQYQTGDTESLNRQCTLLGTDNKGHRYGCDTPHAMVQVELMDDGTGIMISDPKPLAATAE